MSFKNIFLLLMLSVVMVISSHGQVAVGLKGGSNFSTIEVYKRPDFRTLDVKPIQGFQFGAVIRYVSEKHVGFHAEILYTQKGWKHVSLIESVDTLYERTIDYLEVPIMTHFIIGSKKIRILLEGGMYGAYALSSRYKSESSNGVTKSGDYQFRDGIDNRWDYGLIGSAGLQYFSSVGAIEVKAFYSYGYGNIFLDKSEAVEISQNRVYGINISYLYFFGNRKQANQEIVPK